MERALPQRKPRVRKLNKKVKKVVNKEVKVDLKKEMGKIKNQLTKEVKEKAKNPRNLNIPYKKLSTRGSKATEKIILSFTLPFEYPVQRVQIGYNNTKVAVANPFSRFSGTFNQTDDTVGFHQEPSELVVFQFRDLLRSAIVYHGALVEYRYSLLDSGGGTTQTLGQNVDYKPIIFQRAQYFSGFEAHGPYLYPGTDEITNDGLNFFWIDSSGDSRIITAHAAATSIGTFRLTHWLPNEDVVSDFPYLIGSTGVNVVIPDSGYYALSYISADQIINFSAQIYVTNSDSYRHFAIPFIESNFGALGSTSILTFAHVFTNDAPPLDRGGMITRLQIPKSQYWFEIRDFTTISAAQNSSTITYENGSYSWPKLEDTDDIAFRSQVLSQSGQIEKMTFSLQTYSSYLVTCAKSMKIPGRSAYLQFVWGLVYQTLDPWRSISEPLYNGKELNEALDAMAKMKQHTENPFHFRKLLNEAKKFSIKAVPYIERYGPLAFKMLKDFA